MKIKQFEIILKSKERGFHLVTDEIFGQISKLDQVFFHAKTPTHPPKGLTQEI